MCSSCSIFPIHVHLSIQSSGFKNIDCCYTKQIPFMKQYHTPWNPITSVTNMISRRLQLQYFSGIKYRYSDAASLKKDACHYLIKKSKCRLYFEIKFFIMCSTRAHEHCWLYNSYFNACMQNIVCVWMYLLYI